MTAYLRRLRGLWLLLLLAAPAAAQNLLQSPEAFLGYRLGSRFTPHHLVVEYFEHVAATRAGSVVLRPYGVTYEGRPLLVTFVSSPENVSRLEEIRTANLRRAGLEAGEPMADQPAIVWLSYNVHGNESVSTEAAMATLHALADPGNAQAQGWLRNTVVVLDPCINPDGRERYVSWYRQTRGAVPDADPDAREHQEPWPGGRGNHYLFDLNRDWAWMTQLETQQRIPLYNDWMPHVHVDFHEQGVNEPYYFAPAAEPFHEDVTPWQREFQTTIGRNNARYFDREGWLYFTRQRFDLFYPSYGDTWPTFNGAVGMTYEQGGSGRAGLAIETESGDTLTLADRIAHHHTTGLSTVEATSENAARVVSEFERYFERSRTDPAGRYRSYVVKADNGQDRLAALAAYLDDQQIRYGYSTGRRTARGFSYADGRTENVTITPGDLVISAYQPKSTLLKVLFEPEPFLPDSLTYDITAWALPYAYGLRAYALTDRVEPDARPGTAPVPPVNPPLGRPYAYVAEWSSLQDLRLLAALLRQDVRVRFSTVPFEAENRSFGRGALIITRTDNAALGEHFDRIVTETAGRLGQSLTAASTGFVTRGADFGSSDVRFLRRPKVALLAGEHVSSLGLGEVWHYFDRQIEYPVTLVNEGTLGSVDLSEYEVLVLPSGSYGPVLNDGALERLREWVRGGGRLIAIERAAAFLAGKEGFALKEKDTDTSATAAADSAAALRPYEARERDYIGGEVIGSIFRVRLDNTHPLGFGFPDHYYTLKLDPNAYAYLKDGWNVGTLGRDVHLAGFAGAKTRERLQDALVFGVQPMGRGQVVYLADNPLFRGFWHNGKLLFGNAVFMTGE